LDRFAEEIYIDLIEYFDFNLVDFIRGDVASSPRLVLTMLRNLPEGSRYVAAITSAPEVADATPQGIPAEADPVLEARTWTQDRQLMAQLINSVNVLVRHTISWEQGKAPKLPLVGPAAWRGEGKPAKPLTVMDVLNKITGTNG
jgi:hypothetical protein